MADRQIFYTLEQATTKDLLWCQQNYYLGLSRLMRALIDANALSGLECTPTAVPSLNVDVSAGEIYSLEETDVTSYGVAPQNIPANSAIIMKQGIYNGGTFSMPAPGTVGDSIKYLIQVAFQETDNVNETRLFKVGGLQNVNTRRQDLAIVNVKASAAAPSPVTPTPDAGFLGAWVVTVAYGQTTITSGDIAQYPNAPFFGSYYGLAIQDMLSKTQAAATYTKLPTVGNSGLFFVGSSAVETVGTSNTALPLVQASGPLPFMPGGVFQPTFQCMVNISLYWLYDNATSLQAEVEAVLNGSTQVGLDTIRYGGIAGPMNRSMTINQAFNGTTDYIEFFCRVDSGAADMAIPYLAAVVIAN